MSAAEARDGGLVAALRDDALLPVVTGSHAWILGTGDTRLHVPFVTSDPIAVQHAGGRPAMLGHLSPREIGAVAALATLHARRPARVGRPWSWIAAALNAWLAGRRLPGLLPNDAEADARLALLELELLLALGAPPDVVGAVPGDPVAVARRLLGAADAWHRRETASEAEELPPAARAVAPFPRTPAEALAALPGDPSVRTRGLWELDAHGGKVRVGVHPSWDGPGPDHRVVLRRLTTWVDDWRALSRRRLGDAAALLAGLRALELLRPVTAAAVEARRALLASLVLVLEDGPHAKHAIGAAVDRLRASAATGAIACCAPPEPVWAAGPHHAILGAVERLCWRHAPVPGPPAPGTPLRVHAPDLDEHHHTGHATASTRVPDGHAKVAFGRRGPVRTFPLAVLRAPLPRLLG